ncbi:MAG: zeta toxin family protein [Terracidiphilus sp.]
MKALERRPILLVLAGPNGAGKSTFYHAHLEPYGLRFVNADDLSRELDLDARNGAIAAERIRRELMARGESFAFETVFSDPVGDKLKFLKEAEEAGYSVVVFFMGIDSSATAEDRVTMRVAQGEHDVPRDKIITRYPRVMENLRRALLDLSNVRVYDNSNLSSPYRLVALVEDAELTVIPPTPEWLKPLLPRK